MVYLHRNGDLEHGISPVMKDTTNFYTAREEKIIQEYYSTVEKEEEESQPPNSVPSWLFK